MKYARDLAPREDTPSIALAHDSPTSASRTRGPSGNLLALQRAVGNRAARRLIQAKPSPNLPPELAPDFGSRIHGLIGGGRPLAASLRAFFEPRYGLDFSRVRVHTDRPAAQAASELNALAFTIGREIFFGAGQYAPATQGCRQLFAHELAHVVQQTSNLWPVDVPAIQCDNGQGEVVTDPEEQRRRFIEAFRANPAAALASIGQVLETGGGEFEVYGLVYYDTQTRELRFERRHAARNQAILAELQRLMSRSVTNPSEELSRLRGLMQQLASLGEAGFQQRVENWFHDPSEALQTLQRVDSEIEAGHDGYPAVSNDQLRQVADVVEAFATSHAMAIPAEERPRPEGTVLLGYFHSHPTTSPPSGLAGFPSVEGDISVAVDEGSFLIAGTPSSPRIFFIAEGRYWDLGNALQSAIEQQVEYIAGYDQALGGLFLNVIFGAEGFLPAMRVSERPGMRLSQAFTIGDYRLRLEGTLNPALSSKERVLESPALVRLTEASSLRGALEFNFTHQPYIPGNITLEYLSEGAFTIRGRLTPWPLTVASITLGGGATVFEGRVGSEAEGYIELGMQGISPFLIPALSPPGELGATVRFFKPGRRVALDAFYQNPWFRLGYTLTSPRPGEATQGVSGTYDYRLPAGTLQVQLGYHEGVFGSIGYRLNLP